MKYNSAAVYHFITGEFMFYCDRRRAAWYLKKNLATVLHSSEERLEIRLNFESKGPGPNDEFSSHEIVQHCVICGSEHMLTKHHIVPSCYRKFFPTEYKSRINHDVVIVCEPHHHIYEDFANVVKEHLALKYRVPTLQECSELKGPSSNPILKKYNVIRSLLKTYFQQLETGNVSPKLIEKMNIVGINTTDDLKKLLEDTENQIETVLNLSITVEHGQLLVSRLENIDKFIRMWRNHFIETMAPQYMPQGWSVEYKTKITN